MKKLLFLIILSLNFSLHPISYTDKLLEFRPFRPGVAVIAGIKGAIATLQLEIDRIESEAVGVPTLKKELKIAQKELADAKNKLGVGYLEIQLNALENKFDGFAMRFYKTAQVDEIYLYNTLNEKMTNIYNAPEIKRRIENIVKLTHEIAEIKDKNPTSNEIAIKESTINQLRNEIKRRIAAAIAEIKDIGTQINIMTAQNQQGSHLINNQVQMIEQRLAGASSSAELKAKLEPLEQKVENIERQIDDTLALRFTDDRLILLDQYRNQIRQYELLLRLLRHPHLILNLTSTDIIGY